MRRSIVRKSLSVLAAALTGAGSAVAAGLPAAAAGPELKLSASDDTYTSSGRRTVTFGGEATVTAGRLGNDTRISFLKFVVPAGASVTGARLKLVTVGGINGTITVSRVADNGWTENTLTAANAPAIGLPVASATPKPMDVEMAFDLGAEIYGPGTYSFAIQSSSTTAVTRIRSAEGKWGAPALMVSTAGTAPGTTSTTPATTTPAPAPTTTKPSAPAPAATTPAATTPAATTPAATTPAATTPAATTPAATTPAATTPAATTPAATTPAATKPAPTTPAATTPAASTPTTPAGGCVTGALLVPSCGVLWGAAAGGFTSAPRDQEHKAWEKSSGRTATIFHTYHKGDEKFPTAAEITMSRDAAHPRVLLLNWKVEYGSTWANVAAGKLDARIDAFAARIKSTFPEKFFLVLNHEPEDDVNPAAGSGMTAKDFAASYRHVTLRLRAKGVTNAISVVAYMGNEKWMAQSWWKDLYPGDDVVDWVGLDSYVSVEPGYYHNGKFADLLDRKAPNGPGFYDWAVTQHPTKPVMVAEWGAYHRVGKVFDKSAVFNSVVPELVKRPAIKAIVYFDTKNDNTGDRDISIDSSKTSLAAFKNLAANPIFNVKLG